MSRFCPRTLPGQLIVLSFIWVVKVVANDRPQLFAPKSAVDKADGSAVTLIEYLDELLSLKSAKEAASPSASAAETKGKPGDSKIAALPAAVASLLELSGSGGADDDEADMEAEFDRILLKGRSASDAADLSEGGYSGAGAAGVRDLLAEFKSPLLRAASAGGSAGGGSGGSGGASSMLRLGLGESAAGSAFDSAGAGDSKRPTSPSGSLHDVLYQGLHAPAGSSASASGVLSAAAHKHAQIEVRRCASSAARSLQRLPGACWSGCVRIAVSPVVPARTSEARDAVLSVSP